MMLSALYANNPLDTNKSCTVCESWLELLLYYFALEGRFQTATRRRNSVSSSPQLTAGVFEERSGRA